MTRNNITAAVAYYTAMGEKNIESLEKYLHQDVQFTGPLAKTSGKEALVEATKKFMTFLKTLKVRATLIQNIKRWSL